jgi:NADH dehydrogenase
VDFNGKQVLLDDGSKLSCQKLIWAAGIVAWKIPGLPEAIFTHGNRIKVDRYNRADGIEDVFVIGDQALMQEPGYETGHPQVAQAAIQHARNLAANLIRMEENKLLREFRYRNLGSLATIGRNKAVADLPKMKLQGFFAWLLWLIVHLKGILGIKNKIFILINWIWNYLTYDQSLRLIIRHKIKPGKKE